MEFKGTKNWRIRFMEYGDNPDPDLGFFIEADKLNPSHSYNVEVLGDDYGSDYYPTEIRLADAKLIAAAPELLKALQELLHAKQAILDYGMEEEIEFAEKAIEKALK